MSLISSLAKRSAYGKQLREELMQMKAARDEARSALKAAKSELKVRREREGFPALASLTYAGEMRATLAELSADPSLQARIPGLQELAPRASIAVSDRDIMLKKSTVRHYLSTGLSALDSIFTSCPELSSHTPLRILDFGCGYGRVLRMLKAAWPNSVSFVCDVAPDGLAFCMEHFEVTGFRSQIRPQTVPLAHGFDLIWVGSLITHLNEDSLMGFISLFRHLLEPGGRVVFTTHGDYVIERLKAGEFHYDLTPEQQQNIIRSYEKSGYAYEDYVKSPGYGVSATSASWLRPRVEALGRMRFRAHLPHYWDNHQDVWCFQMEG
jgi:SAM-dependent methyltransferase